MTIRVFYYLGIGCAIIAVIGGLIGLSVLQIVFPDIFPSPMYAVIEDIMGFFVALFLASSIVTWTYAYKLTKLQWTEMDSEQKMARAILMMFGFFLIGYVLFYREEIQKNGVTT